MACSGAPFNSLVGAHAFTRDCAEHLPLQIASQCIRAIAEYRAGLRQFIALSRSRSTNNMRLLRFCTHY